MKRKLTEILNEVANCPKQIVVLVILFETEPSSSSLSKRAKHFI